MLKPQFADKGIENPPVEVTWGRIYVSSGDVGNLGTTFPVHYERYALTALQT